MFILHYSVSARHYVYARIAVIYVLDKLVLETLVAVLSHFKLFLQADEQIHCQWFAVSSSQNCLVFEQADAIHDGGIWFRQ